MPLSALANKSYRIDYDYYIERIASVLERPLKITHNLTEKQIIYALKGLRGYTPKTYKTNKTKTH